MSLTLQTNITVREQGRNLFADFPEMPNAGYFFSNFQMTDGSTVWCRTNRTAREGLIYHFVKILNPQNPENREFFVVDTSRLDPLERRPFLPFENFIFDREREIELHEMHMQSAEQSRSFTVIRELQADIRQQHATLERQIGALEQQNANFERQNANFERQNTQMRVLNSEQDTMIRQLHAETQISRSELSREQQILMGQLAEARISRSELSREQQALLDRVGQPPTTHITCGVQHIGTGTANSPDPNAGFFGGASASLSSAQVAVSSPMGNRLSTPNTAPGYHPVINQIHQASAPPLANQSHQQQVSQQENASTRSMSSTNPYFPISGDSFSDESAHTSQDNNEASFWQKMQEGISFLFSSIKQGWEYFISLF